MRLDTEQAITDVLAVVNVGCWNDIEIYAYLGGFA